MTDRRADDPLEPAARRYAPPMADHRLRLTHDPVATAAYSYVVDSIGPGEVATSRVLNHYIDEASIVLAFDADNRHRASGVTDLLRSVPSTPA
jgi:hypothetical protein